MKNMTLIRAIALIYAIGAGICTAEGISVSLATPSIPVGSDGLVHIRTGENETQPLQLSKNHFSKPVRISATKLEIYRDPLDSGEEKPAPLVSMDLSADGGPYKVFVWGATGENGEVRWIGKAFASENWPAACMILVNFTDRVIGFESGKLRQAIEMGKTLVFKGDKEANGSPVKLYSVDPADQKSRKLIFSSVWRVPENEQEIIVIYPANSFGRSVMTLSFLAQKEPSNPQD